MNKNTQYNSKDTTYLYFNEKVIACKRQKIKCRHNFEHIKQKIYFIQKVIGHNLLFCQHLPVSDLSQWLSPFWTQHRITTSFNRDLISRVCSSSALSLKTNRQVCACMSVKCLGIRVILKMQASRNLQYIAL